MTERVLLIDADPDHSATTEAALKASGYEVDTAADADAALSLARSRMYQAILVALGEHEPAGLTLCEALTAACPEVPLLVAATMATVESVGAAFRAGASDYLRKPVDARELTCRIIRATCRADVRRELTRVNAVDFTGDAEDTLRGRSGAMRALRELIKRVAHGEGAVLIQGETGTGKEVVAREIHRLSGRAAKPFVAVNCAAIPETLLESELFGHVRGAFTDAKADKPGLFSQASGGTLFLDEIGDMPLAMQSKLLRALQDQCARPVGGQHEVAFDLRVIVATHRNLEQRVASGLFRQDLFYRVSVFPVTIPALRERREDMLELASYFLARAATREGRPRLRLSLSAAEAIMAHEFPGNVRELENAMARAAALARFDEVVPDDLPETVRKAKPNGAVDEEPLLTWEEVAHRYVVQVLNRVSGNKSQAAHLLQVDRRTLLRKACMPRRTQVTARQAGPVALAETRRGDEKPN